MLPQSFLFENYNIMQLHNHYFLALTLSLSMYQQKSIDIIFFLLILVNRNQLLLQIENEWNNKKKKNWNFYFFFSMVLENAFGKTKKNIKTYKKVFYAFFFVAVEFTFRRNTYFVTLHRSWTTYKTEKIVKIVEQRKKLCLACGSIEE